jgi:hypothetical protein
LAATLQTSIVLCERFSSTLAPNAAPVDELAVATTNNQPDAPSPLILLNAAAAALKSQVTKLSLLAITAPFTPTAVTTCLTSLNESILTSLVTAALLTTPESSTSSFSAECRSLSAAALRDLQALLRSLEGRSKEKPRAEVSQQVKAAFTETTGRVWDDCDKLSALATEGVPGYVVRKSKQWLDLMKDAVKELEDWDPEQDIDDDDPFGDGLSDEEDHNSHDDKQNTTSTTDDDRSAISAGVKDQALKVLSRIPQSIHVVIKQRLEKIDATALPPDHTTQLDTILSHNRHISELIDESAEGMYLGDLELCLKKAGEARALTIEVVESVVQPFLQGNGNGATVAGTKEDKYVKRALEWIQQVDPGGFPRNGESSV